MLFDHAPVMMHAVDRNQRIVRVNRRWLQRLGYKRAEVLGHSSVDFLTDESRAWGVKDAIPLFWRVGSSRSAGAAFVKKDGRVLDVLIDAEVCPVTLCEFSAYAVLRDGHDSTQWEQASRTLRALQELTGVQSKIESVLLATEGDAPDANTLALQQSFDLEPKADMALEVLGSVSELAQDISINLRSLVRLQEDRLDATVEQQRELLLLLKSIDRTLAELRDTAAELGRMSQ